MLAVQDKKPEVHTEVKRLQQEFADLLQNRNASKLGPDQLTSGQMLLMGFSGLFSRLEADFAELLDNMQSLDVPAVWKKVDTVREAKSMQVRMSGINLMWVDISGYMPTMCNQLKIPTK